MRGDPSIPSTHEDSKRVTAVVIVAHDRTELVVAEVKLERERSSRAAAQASELAAKEANRLKCVLLSTLSSSLLLIHSRNRPFSPFFPSRNPLLFGTNLPPSARTEFLTTVSHEIRTPIASILGICELLLADQLSGEQRSLVEKAIQSGENLLDLVGTVLVRFFFLSIPSSSSPSLRFHSSLLFPLLLFSFPLD
jgi:signal transduction histidine kinase